MKLLLTSGGLSNESIISALRELTKRPFNKLNLAFIPTAANLEDGDKWWFIEDLATCKKLGFKSIDIVDISALPQDVWLKRLQAANIILVEGGNTYHLLYWMYRSGLDKVLSKLLETRVYIGISAGTMVVTPSMGLSTSEQAPVTRIGETLFDEGLKLVDFLIEPHLNNSYFPELTLTNVKKEAQALPFPVYALDDNSAIVVNGSILRVVSEGKWKKFEQGL